jgi:hypothetical protein
MSDAPSAKDIRVAPIAAADARALIRRLHYSGKVDPRSSLHLGVFLGGRLEGAMQFGPSMDKRKTLGLVPGTAWNGFLELNRMAFGEALPRNSESRALAVAFRLIRKAYPHIEWVVSYSDATQCGDGTIYRAAGFLLTGIKQNSTIYRLPSGERVAKIVLEPGFSPNSGAGSLKARLGVRGGESASAYLRRVGAERVQGFQLRYVYFLNPAARERLAVPVLPFDKIDAMGAGMYRGERVTRSQRAKEQDAGHPPALGGATPTRALHSSTEA